MKTFSGFLFVTVALLFSLPANAQLKNYKLSVDGDTLNAVDANGMKQGKWVIHADPLRGEPGYEEEGMYVDGKREGQWRKYNLSGDFLALENYRLDGKDGTSKYFTPYGDIIREENWRAYDPNAPYDTVAIYGEGNNEIISYKIVKAELYSVKHGDWVYYDTSTGRIIKTEKYDRGHLLKSKKDSDIVLDEPMKKIKPKEVLEYEKKHAGKKKFKVRDGRTGN